jgi:hypothetical protein
MITTQLYHIGLLFLKKTIAISVDGMSCGLFV